jgi:hypothetical protein
MKLLVIICSDYFKSSNLPYITSLVSFLSKKNITIDYCGISNQDDFNNYESVINFKYKIINTKFQASKILDFTSSYNKELDYDWYMKWRPDLRLIDDIDFNVLCKESINARARVYIGPKKIKYGKSVNGPGSFLGVTDGGYYSTIEEKIVLDDMCYIFSDKVLKSSLIEPIKSEGQEHEWIHTDIWKKRNIGLNIIGINVENMKWKSYSGDI